MVKEIYIIDDDESSIMVFNKLFENDPEFKFISVKSEQIDLALKNIPSIIIINEDAIEVDIIELCKNVELVIDLIENKEEEYLFKAKTSRKFILENYSIEEQERTIVDAWNDILTRA